VVSAAKAEGHPADRLVKKNNADRNMVLRIADFQFHFLIRVSLGCRTSRSNAPPTLTPLRSPLEAGVCAEEFLSAEEFWGLATNIGKERSANCKLGWMEGLCGLLTGPLRRLLKWICSCPAFFQPSQEAGSGQFEFYES